MVLQGPFGWQHITMHDALWALGKLDSYGSMRWTDILGRDSHAVSVGEILNHRVAKELERIGLGDVEGSTRASKPGGTIGRPENASAPASDGAEAEVVA